MSENQSIPEFQPVHVCKNCGHELLRSEMDAYALISGVVQCPACGQPSALNVEIRSYEEKKPPRSDGET
jgi:rRNA maturation endonuclease Nob1